MNSYEALARTVTAEASEPFDWSQKASQPDWYGRTRGEVAGLVPALHAQSTPMMTIDAPIMARNIAGMARWCTAHGVELAPHGKTTMSPRIWLAQLQAGAWGITVATEAQLRIARGAGVPRVLLANSLIRAEALVWLADQLAEGDFEFSCWVDSERSIRLMEAALANRPDTRINVAIEVGHTPGRTGARTIDEISALADLVVASPVLTLAGISGYEGVAAHGHSAADLNAVDAYLDTMRRAFETVDGRFATARPFITAGGSAYFDRVVAAFDSLDATVVLRSGAYVVHDDGIYSAITPARRQAGPRLDSAIHVWARVISRPERNLAILDAGRRDLPYDEGLPVAQIAVRNGTDTIALAGHTIVDLNDQHAYLTVPTESELRVGDLVRLGLSHPCAAFDRWTTIAMVDDSAAANPTIIDFARSYFG